MRGWSDPLAVLLMIGNLRLPGHQQGCELAIAENTRDGEGEKRIGGALMGRFDEIVVEHVPDELGGCFHLHFFQNVRPVGIDG